MRLIDADELIEICRKGWKLFGGEDEKLKHWVDEDDIRNQPTIKAILIEWIAEWVTTHADFSWSMMLHDWEKENEID